MTYTLQLTDEDLGILAQALDNVIFRLAAPLINKINTQLTEQKEPSHEPV
jgi:hypothetical protein